MSTAAVSASFSQTSTSTETDSSQAAGSDGSVAAQVRTTVVFNTASASPEIITTTLYTGPTISATAYPTSHKQSVPVGAIVGGTLGGVALAVSAVIIWIWWGRCIQRQEEKDRKERLARRQVRENTRRNASSAASTRLSASFPASRHERKVSFVPNTASSSQTSSNEKPEPKTSYLDPPVSLPRSSLNAHKPARPSPLGLSSSRNEEVPLLASTPVSEVPTPPTPPTPHSPGPATSQVPSLQSEPTPSVQPFLKRPLANRRSAASSTSAYSAESGEERQKRVSTSLIMAALGYMDPRRSWLGNYLSNRRRSNYDIEQSRLSQMSAASGYSQTEEYSGVPVGYAS
ncbi:uncharacterized protein LAESUDRAFT_368707 [Laetiporus sulphureus 93-53]|uniref:Mid2 domain-containing protein n=1 Tax=Laetiporus sulphureus 93-53 TaxID=1314785 RepID=A0A165CTY5_9APHY|nr:uncharacterized protein LAESUDRAFT_368707 [Laetiporus sulphureus 93-53]KZT03428.1 hypothetical protein LAESUDRAFT_368707 [Laetiporus sulphureus 93-53]